MVVIWAVLGERVVGIFGVGVLMVKAWEGSGCCVVWMCGMDVW